MITTTIHTQDQKPAAPDQLTRMFAQWGLPHTVTPRLALGATKRRLPGSRISSWLTNWVMGTWRKIAMPMMAPF